MSFQDLNNRVLVLAHIGRDSELLKLFLDRHGFEAHVVGNAHELLGEISRGAAIAIVAEESLRIANHDWSKRLEMQPPWSDFPLIVLTSLSDRELPSPTLTSLRHLGNVTLLERPVPSESLLSAVQSAMRARSRQYEIRDFLHRQADSEEALRRTEKLAVAGRLAASMAHEINNPLTAVTNLLFLVGTASSAEEAHDYALQAQDELRRVSEIANHTLGFHRSAKGPEEIDVAQLLESTAVLFRAKLRNQDIKLDLQCEEECRMVCAAGEIRQVLVNLVANAIDAMRKGGHLVLRATGVQHPRTSIAGVRISVVDHGDGISVEALSKLFEPFFTTKGNTGTGLGLWLTKDIIDRHQGFIRARNHRNPHGAVFSFWLPQQPSASEFHDESQGGKTDSRVA